jgi:hypothetical protein
MLNYYRGRWPDDPVPPDSPIWLHYEVDLDRDAVLRSVELFAGGYSERNSLELEERDGFPCISLWSDAAAPSIVESKLELISAGEFEELWKKSVDKPGDSLAPRSRE